MRASFSSIDCIICNEMIIEDVRMPVGTGLVSPRRLVWEYIRGVVCCRGRRISGCKQPVRTSSFLVLLLGRKVELTWANSTVHTVPVVYTLVSIYLSVQSFLLDQFTSCASPSTTKEYNKNIYIYILCTHVCTYIHPLLLVCTVHSYA